MWMRMRTVLLVLIVALTTFCVLPVTSLAATTKASHRWMITTHLAFTSLITRGSGKGELKIGGLSLQLDQKSGYFTGTLNLPDGSSEDVSGRFVRSALVIQFPDFSPGTSARAGGKLNPAGEFVGNFKVFARKLSIASGKWSALAVLRSDDFLSLAFDGQVQRGLRHCLRLEGALLLNWSTWKGRLNMPDGRIIPVKAHQYQATITMTFFLSKKLRLFATGIAGQDGPLHGMIGRFLDSLKKGSVGDWSGYMFSF